MYALAAARAFTGKRKVVVFGDGYHGGVFMFPNGKPAPINIDLDDWIVATYNNIESATAAIQSEGVAAVIVEGSQGAGGCIPGHPDFLLAIQKAAREVG
jgi:glutamate-1-semialdehyde 2,1-aminomutase